MDTANSTPPAIPTPSPAETQRSVQAALAAARAGDPRRFEAELCVLRTAPSLDARVLASLAITAQDHGLIRHLRSCIGALGPDWLWAAAASTDPALRFHAAERAVRCWPQAGVTVWGHPSATNAPAPTYRQTPEISAAVSAFLSEGAVALRGAVPQPRIDAWLDHLARHARQKASSGQHFPGARAVERLDPFNAGGAFRGRLRIGTGALLPLPFLSPNVCEVVHALVGGVGHIRPHYSDQLLFSNHVNAPWVWAGLRGLRLAQRSARWIIGRGWSESLMWHLDETPERGHIDQQRLALLMLVLFTDVHEDQGPTAFLPDSAPRVARALRDQPGSNQDDWRWVSTISRRCGPPRLATGSAGDVFLLHPLTLHTRAPTNQTTFRVIANGNLFATAPLAYRDPRSPVERYGAQRL